ncbi:hypothetical protein [Citrobacter freundii]|uniref:hypothetical protein n=1 Tax=Citrobacter freundii TaxID=546 RepID=UPI00374F2C0B
MTTNNHPAHCPVSLDRLHQISEILSKAAAQSDGGNLGYAMADAVKVIDGAIAEFEEQDNRRPVMAVKGELGFIDNLEKIIEERDEDIDIGQLGRSNYDALMLAALDAFIASLPATEVPSEMVNNIDNHYGDEDLIYEQGKIEGWNACRAAMLQSFGNPEQLDEVGSWNNHMNTPTAQAGNSPAAPDGYVLVPKEMTPEMMRAVQIKSELGGYAASELSGAYDMFAEFWDVAVSAAPQQEDL